MSPFCILKLKQTFAHKKSIKIHILALQCIAFLLQKIKAFNLLGRSIVGVLNFIAKFKPVLTHSKSLNLPIKGSNSVPSGSLDGTKKKYPSLSHFYLGLTPVNCINNLHNFIHSSGSKFIFQNCEVFRKNRTNPISRLC